MNDNIASPKISVIVPVYNSEKFLPRCLESIFDQTTEEKYEVIAVNDGSTDNSLEILKGYAENFKNLRILTRKNGGVSSARNAGIAHAKGEYIAFVDSDDFVERDYLEKLYSAAEQSSADIAICNYKNTNSENSLSIGCIFRHRSGVFDSGKMLRSLLCDVTVRSYLWNKLYKRELFTENGIEFPLGVHFEDFTIMPKLFYYSRKIVQVPDKLYNYVQRKGSITGSLSSKSIMDYVSAYGNIREFLDEKCALDEYRAYFVFLGIKIACTVVLMLIGCSRRERGLELFKAIEKALSELARSAVSPQSALKNRRPNPAE